jgi:nucleotide-binding universal stress UspA family protein
MTQIIACIDQSQAALAVCDYAIWSCQRIQAPLKFLHVLDEQQYPAPTDFSGNIGLGSRENLLDELATLDEARNKLGRENGQHLLDTAKQRARDAGIENPHCSQRHGDLTETVKELEQETRLLIMGRQGENSASESPLVGSHIESIVRTLHRPILITPQAFTAPERFLIAYDGSPTSRKCVEMIVASPLIKNLECHLLTASAKTDEALENLAWAEQLLNGAGFNVTSSIRDGNIEDVIMDYCEQQQIHLLAMGAYGHSRIRQFWVGSTTTKLLARAKIPLLLLR